MLNVEGPSGLVQTMSTFSSAITRSAGFLYSFLLIVTYLMIFLPFTMLMPFCSAPSRTPLSE